MSLDGQGARSSSVWRFQSCTKWTKLVQYVEAPVPDTKLVNVHDAKTHFSKLLDRVAGGEEIIIAKAGKPVARLVPYGPASPENSRGMRG